MKESPDFGVYVLEADASNGNAKIFADLEVFVWERTVQRRLSA